MDKLRHHILEAIILRAGHAGKGHTPSLHLCVGEEGEITLKGLKLLANKVSKLGCWRTSRFIQSSANYMVTYALLVIKGIKIPWNSNTIERLMEEIAKRVRTSGCTGLPGG